MLAVPSMEGLGRCSGNDPALPASGHHLPWYEGKQMALAPNTEGNELTARRSTPARSALVELTEPTA